MFTNQPLFSLCARFIWLAALFLPVSPVFSAETSPKTALTQSTYPELWAIRDEQLTRRMEASLRSIGLDSAVQAGTLSVSITDITDPLTPKYAGLNDEQMFYAASLPKIAILLGAFYRAETSGQLMPADIYDDAIKMIRFSNNAAATRVLSWIGNEFLVEMLQSDSLRLYDLNHNGGLWVGRGYASGTEYKKDPLHNTSHGANTLQISRFWYLLATERLVNAERSREMKRLMANPVFNNKLVLGLASRPGLRIYRKTGTFKQYHGDGALIETGSGAQTRRYIIAALATDESGGDWIRRLAAPLYDLLSTYSGHN